MKIAYVGIDAFDGPLKALLELKDIEIYKLFTCRTDNKTEFNTEVIALAEQNGIPWTLERITEADMQELKAAGCEAVICGGYYHKIPISGVIRVVNTHPSILPYGRGAWPMPIMILNRHERGGVTVHRMTPGWDEGEIILQETFPLDERENLKTITAKIEATTKKLVKELMADFDALWENARPQCGGDYWKNPSEPDWTVRPDMSAEETDRILRAFYGYECVWNDNGKRYELIDGEWFDEKAAVPEGWRVFESDCGGCVAAPRVKRLGEEITPEMRSEVDRLRAIEGDRSSAWAFQSLYIWRKAMKLTIVLEKDFAAVNCAYRGDNTWFFPIGEKNACAAFIREHMDEQNFAMTYVQERQIGLLNEYFPGYFEIKEAPEDEEYILDIAEQMTLAGKRYNTARSQLHKASRAHRVSIRPMEPEDETLALDILSSWEETENSWLAGNEAEKDALLNRAALDMEFYLSYADDRLCGVIGGFPINKDSFDVVAAKETIRFPGLSYSVKHCLHEKLAGRYLTANYEEDLGLEGIRMMKSNLAPVEKIKMWNVKRKHES